MRAEAGRRTVEQRHGAAARLGRPRAEHGTHGHDADVGAHDLVGVRVGCRVRVRLRVRAARLVRVSG